MKKVLVIGNEGYVGPLVINEFKKQYNQSYIAGFDTGFFTHIITSNSFPENKLDVQYRGDVRNLSESILRDFDVIIYLAAISNDPMGNAFEFVTKEINQECAIEIARKAKKVGVERFIFASSCSVYGFSEDGPRDENSVVNPLTAYAKSKVSSEKKLEKLADNNFIITCLRFATACGFSPRLRLDLVLNDFVASAIALNKINILSDGFPWRPLIHVKDMARAMNWASNRLASESGNFLIINTGSNNWNYQVKDLAYAVRDSLGDVKININKEAAPDKRSYKVNFSLYEKLANGFLPEINLKNAIVDLYNGLKNINFKDDNFRQSNLIRHNVINGHIKSKRLNKKLFWN